MRVQAIAAAGRTFDDGFPNWWWRLVHSGYFENVGGSAAKTDDEIDIRFHCLHFLMRVALHDAH